MTAAQSVIDTDSWKGDSLSVSLPPMVAQKTASAVETKPLSQIADWTPRSYSRHVPVLVKINQVLRAILIACCGFALLGYGLDVAATAEVSKLQEQARRLSEQNTELSAQLLRAISFQGIQANVVGHAGLRVPDQVVITPEKKPPVVKEFKPRRHFLPVHAGY